MAATLSLQQDLYGTGRHYGQPVPWPAGKTGLVVTALMSNTDVVNPANSATIGVEVSFDGGKSYSFDASAGWTGAPPFAGPPMMPAVNNSFSGSGSVPSHVRPFVDVPNPLSIGLTVDFS